MHPDYRLNADYPLNDTQFEEMKVARVEASEDGWIVTSDQGTSLYIPPYSATPATGDDMRWYGAGIGFPVRGVFIAGVEVYYYTAEAYQQKLQAEQAQRDTERKAEAEAKRDEHATRIAALPMVLQRRFDRFRAGNPDFDWQFLSYELLCCEEAVRIMQWALDPSQADAPANNVKRFAELRYEEQKAAIPAMAEGHSGNTFAFSIRLAYLLLTDPDEAAAEHGAMVPLVGCVKYGCTHATVVP